VQDAGTIVLLGLAGSPVSIDVDQAVVRDLRMIGSLGSPHMWPAAIDLVSTGRVRPSLLVSHEFPITAVSDAYALAQGGDVTTRKVLVDPTRHTTPR
jgi:threonine dehydrogenase-like Zn-dependent dehydrogenase